MNLFHRLPAAYPDELKKALKEIHNQASAIETMVADSTASDEDFLKLAKTVLVAINKVLPKSNDKTKDGAGLWAKFNSEQGLRFKKSPPMVEKRGTTITGTYLESSSNETVASMKFTLPLLPRHSAPRTLAVVGRHRELALELSPEWRPSSSASTQSQRRRNETP